MEEDYLEMRIHRLPIKTMLLFIWKNPFIAPTRQASPSHNSCQVNEGRHSPLIYKYSAPSFPQKFWILQRPQLFKNGWIFEELKRACSIWGDGHISETNEGVMGAYIWEKIARAEIFGNPPFYIVNLLALFELSKSICQIIDSILANSRRISIWDEGFLFEEWRSLWCSKLS